MDLVTVVGLIAAFLTTGAFVPQAIKTIKTKSTHDLSLVTFSMLFFGNTTWLIYGLFIQNLPLVVANSITVILCGVILYLKITVKQNIPE